MGAENELGELHIQEFLDELADLNLEPKIQSWYNIDVTAMLGDANILYHEINNETGCAILFLPKSIIHFCPNQRKMQHYPKHLVHCFVDHPAENQQTNPYKSVYSAEIFSISPSNELLNWSIQTNSERDIPKLQEKTALWLRYLNA
tara:strand:- start:131 stop:568 length:438 start_codon:yes stop_codon:yes gene_type:complete